MSRRILVLAAAALGALSLAACNDDKATTAGQPAASPAPSAATSAAASSAPSASAKGSGSPKPSSSAKAAAGAVPDICKIVSKAEINMLTGEQVTLMTDDGGATPASRYCQWQLSQGQVTIAVSLETRENFDVRNKQATAVPGIGTTAYSLAGHLYVWQGGRDVDVYVSSESSDAANLSVAKRAAQQLLPRLEAAAK
ncbi:hypothetical protein [Dactylosporangium matsuzakiense]|uniref:DUF3558 domain-containing protein n=1 Tax=Dactylosporangium matsuzakiense TaxID=53360 RepID=A0A9W6KPM9_9ACTN|nr:hypothetical protein [Dactylosporangium matsuzakiense]UWZ47471.1 hypothetical protein Dmats_14325 [Dactylosporangium matsuzakiense]GLL05228.1 hypothetical protein GCM10017581_069750 [Dactylosporangium matsuzakiense]